MRMVHEEAPISAQLSRPWQAARRILCVRLDSLGDVLMCTPAIRALRQSLPGSNLALLSSPSGAAVAPHIPELDAALEALGYKEPVAPSAP